jgi:hypothetical protein
MGVDEVASKEKSKLSFFANAVKKDHKVGVKFASCHNVEALHDLSEPRGFVEQVDSSDLNFRVVIEQLPHYWDRNQD